MKSIGESTLTEFEETAREGARQIRAFFAYKGENPNYYNRARVGAAIISAYSRLRASETNRAALILAGAKLDSPGRALLQTAGLLPQQTEQTEQ